MIAARHDDDDETLTGRKRAKLKKTKKVITLSRLLIGHERITHSYLLEGK